MKRFVLVPGGWHGGRAFDAVRRRLAGEGQEVAIVYAHAYVRGHGCHLEALRTVGGWRKIDAALTRHESNSQGSLS